MKLFCLIGSVILAMELGLSPHHGAGAAAPESFNRGLIETAEPLNDGQLKAMQDAFAGKKTYHSTQNALTVTPLTKLAMNRNIMTQTDDSFSCKLDDWPVTNQKQSGRCWMFAGLNLLRCGAMKTMNLKEFEFSQSYLFFWDKIERANYFLESILDTGDQPDGDRVVDFLLSTSLGDGGQWNMFVSLVRKYGLVPKSAMPETESSSNSHMMNQMVRAKLHEGAKLLRDKMAHGASADELRAVKADVMTTIYRMLSLHMGTPPQRFDWQWRDKDNKFHRDGELTGREFAKKYVTLNLDDYVCLVNDPRSTSPMGRTFTVAYLGNVVGGDPILYLNVDAALMKQIAMKTMLEGEPVWFGCDVGKQMEKDRGLWDSNLFDFAGVYDTSFGLTKADRLIYQQTCMTHAMVFTGVDVVNDQPRRWRVENSWGDEIGTKGFFTMNDSWFDEYVFEVAVRRSLLPEPMQKALDQPPIILPPWDPMGALAHSE